MDPPKRPGPPGGLPPLRPSGSGGLPPQRPGGSGSTPCLSGSEPQGEKKMTAVERLQGKKRGPVMPCRDYTPIYWGEYFDSKEVVSTNPDDKFTVYRLSSTVICKENPLVVFLHGGGYSGLTWARAASCLVDMVEIATIAIDIRGHGETITKNDHDLSLPTMANDVVGILRELGLEGHSFIFVGHSLGGSLAIHVANMLAKEDLGLGVAGLIVVDVVEGSALNALPNMYSILRNRPFEFKNLEEAIQWCMKTGHCRDSYSARVSMPGQLKYTKNDRPCSLDVPEPSEDVKEKIKQDNGNGNGITKSSSYPLAPKASTIPEEVQEEEEGSDGETKVTIKAPTKAASSPVTSVVDTCTWRVDLDRTDVYWQSWFTGISAMFLAQSCPRMLVLAGVDRLDKDMTIAQMQGKFQMKVIDRVGHTIHEDAPQDVATGLAQFFVRHKLATARRELPAVLPEC